MSNKLVKRSEGYKKSKEELVKKVTETGGININREVISEFVGLNDPEKCTEDEFYSLLEELSNEDFCLYKVEKVENGKSSKGMMLCHKDVTLAFVRPEEGSGEDGGGNL